MIWPAQLAHFLSLIAAKASSIFAGSSIHSARFLYLTYVIPSSFLSTPLCAFLSFLRVFCEPPSFRSVRQDSTILNFTLVPFNIQSKTLFFYALYSPYHTPFYSTLFHLLFLYLISLFNSLSSVLSCPKFHCCKLHTIWSITRFLVTRFSTNARSSQPNYRTVPYKRVRSYNSIRWSKVAYICGIDTRLDSLSIRIQQGIVLSLSCL